MAKSSKKGKASKAAGKGLSRLKAIFLCTLSGIGIFMSFPNFLEVELFPVQWFALVPLLFVLSDLNPKKAFYAAWWTGFVTNLGGFYWITHLLLDFGHLPLSVAVGLCVLNAAYQGLVIGIWGAGSVFFVRRCKIHWLVAAPITFVVAEALIPFLFPWYMANGQYLFYPIIQIVDLTGVSGLTWLILYINVASFLIIKSLRAGRGWPRWTTATAAGFFAVALLYGFVRMAQVDQAMEDAPKITVGMVEADIGIFEKEAKGLSTEKKIQVRLFNLVKHQRLSQSLTKEGVDLLVWPESSYLPVGDISFRQTDLVAVAVGVSGTIYERRHNQWIVPTPSVPEGKGRVAFHGVWAELPNSMVAVGSGGTILHHDGKSWKSIRTATGATFRDVAGVVGPDGSFLEAWVVGEGGEVLRLSPAMEMDSPPFPNRSDLFGVSAQTGHKNGEKTVLIAGASGTVFAQNGQGAFQQETLRDSYTGSLLGIWAGRGGLGFAVGEEGAIFRRVLDGATRRQVWIRERLGAGPVLRSVWGRANNDVYAVGDGGRILHFDGTSWKEDATIPGLSFHGVGGTDDGRVMAVAENGQLMERGWDGKWSSVSIPGREGLKSISGVGFQKDVDLPIDVQALYVSDHSLPGGTSPEAVWYEENRVGVREADRTSVQRGFRVPVLFGTIVLEQVGEEFRPYNTALLVDGDGHVLGRYDKNFLLMFGEYIPFGETFPKLYEWIPGNHFYAGKTVETLPFSTDEGTFEVGALICYEDILPRFTRRVAAKGVDLFVNITNDAWFGKTAEPYLHLALAIFRTVENRRYMVRSTNTGVSAFIDANGRIIDATSLEGAEVLKADVPALRMGTLYTRFGDIFMAICFVAIAMFIIHGYWPHTRAGRR